MYLYFLIMQLLTLHDKNVKILTISLCLFEIGPTITDIYWHYTYIILFQQQIVSEQNTV